MVTKAPAPETSPHTASRRRWRQVSGFRPQVRQASGAKQGDALACPGCAQECARDVPGVCRGVPRCAQGVLKVLETTP